MRFFALTVPGLGELLRSELAAHLGPGAVGDVEYDGRGDLVPYAAGPADSIGLRLAEDVFVEVGTGDPAAGLAGLVGQLWSSERYDAALPAIAPALGRLGPRPGFRVVARLRSERAFRRTDLRDELTRAVLRARPRWRPADPAPVELWALQTRPRRVRLGVRVSDRRMRQRGGREVELPGALRPAVAAAMVRLAAPARSRLLDPCCGSGTIVREALEAGRPAIGADLDPAAVAASRANLPPGTPLLVSDVSALGLAAGCAGAVACNLPFGRRHPLPADQAGWLGRAYAEMERAVAPGGTIVLLAPHSPAFERAVLRPRAGLLVSRHPIRLLGRRATIWALRRPR